jgi:ubiquinone/menaquinone biosynthesis C-methylase UbiE
MLDLRAVDEGFSRKAEVYDAYCEGHPVIRWARDVIRREVMERIPRDSSILELNAGTGSDAAYFFQHGYRVHATDVAGGMVSAIQTKTKTLNGGERFTVQQVSFTDLDAVQGAPFDLVFSNFGGLNCIPDLHAVTNLLPRLLKPNGHVVWVVMPPFCPWETLQALRGQFRVAFRRFHSNGVSANVENANVMTWYHSPKAVRDAFGADFHLLRQRSISLFCPPSYMDRFPHRYPRLTNALLKMDERIGASFPFNRWGDFLMYAFQYAPV